MMKRNFFIIICLVVIGCFAPAAVKAASLYLSPASGSYTIGDTFNVTVGVNTDGVAINAAQATISFPTDVLEVTGVAKSGTFTLWPIEPSYSNTTGIVSFGGGVPNPGYTGSAGSVITITFQGKVAGTASVIISSGNVLANDGFGTDVLSSRGSGSYTVAAAVEPEPEPEPEPELDLPVAPIITSSTHPEQALWYADSTPAFEWTKESEVTGFSFTYDDQPQTTPDQIRDSTDNSESYSDIGDGVWYFHVRAQNSDGWGPTGHFKTQIDITPPLSFTIDLLDGKKTTERNPRISFTTTDATSGVHHYDLVVNNSNPLGIDVGQTTPYTLSNLEVGDYSLVASAYDYAGNDTSAENSFAVVPVAVVPPTDEEVEEGPAILKLIEDALPEPIRNITENIGEVIQQLRDSKAVTQTVDQAVEPTITVVAVVTAAGVAASATGFELFNLLYLFFRFGYFWLVPVSYGRRRKKPWGVVFDSTTGKPVRRAIVRIFSKEFNKLKESQITDREGRFGFLTDPGEYYVTVTHAGYFFPSRLLQTAALSLYQNIYRGGTFDVKSRIEGSIALNIPIDPEVKEIATRRVGWLRFLNLIGIILEKSNAPLLVGGTILSWISLIIEPKTSNYISLAVYALLILLKVLISRRFERSWGLVTDRQTGEPIEFAVIRIYNTATGTIVGTRVTNKLGQFSSLVAPGQYYVIAAKVGYNTFQSKPIKVTKKRGLIRLGIQMTSQKSATPTMPGPIINLEPMERQYVGEPPATPSLPSSTKQSAPVSSPFTPPPPISSSAQKKVKRSAKK